MAGLMCCIDPMACCNDNCWLVLDRVRYSSKFTVSRVDTELDSRRLILDEKNDDMIPLDRVQCMWLSYKSIIPAPGLMLGFILEKFILLPHLRAS